ncbi:HET-domain-containing protein [Pyrenochaeta sp. DS3sAY3a]|nr:HET-domain-containing protein [Pyrenochaeta sp. DS3sAY3a]
MRLLYTTDDGKLRWTKDYVGVEKVPAYAILSHTWGEQEVTFKDLEKHQNLELSDGTLKAGYQKILFCAQRATRDGLDHFWIDSCCIDKSNNTELSEAINSMFRWYQNAVKCYVYLSDVQNNALNEDGEFALRQSRWFTRGWTLQELLAPNVVEFFSSGGEQLGTKESLRSVIHEITSIPVEALSCSTLSNFSVDDRFSWAENRQTTREEDKAYCLLGIFGVYLPLIYGEGEENALDRLRNAVLKKNDQGHSQRSAERLREICSWLSAPDPSTNYHKAYKLRQADTGLWLLNSTKFTTWKGRAASRLWLYGIPGCGKTILSSAIIEHLLQHCNTDIGIVIAYFFFDFNDAQKQDLELMLRSLLCQLLSSSAMIPQLIDALFSSCRNRQRQPSPQELLESIREMLQLFTHVYIVLDALDECTQRQELMDVLETVAEWQLDNMHLLMTSRKERDIERSFENYLDEEDTICLLSNVVDEDIQRYVQQRLSADRDLAKWNKDSAVRQEIESALMSGARGMYVCSPSH